MNDAYQYSIRLLSMRDYSKYKLRQKLKLKKYPIEEIELALISLEEKKYLQEDRYKTLLVKKYVMKGLADSAIMLHGSRERLKISSEDIKSVRQEMNHSTMDAGEKLIEKKLRNRPIPKDLEDKMKLKSSLFRHLQSKGYSYDESQRLINHHFKETSLD